MRGSEHMSHPQEIAHRFQSIMRPYFGGDASVDLDSRLVSDLGITGWDYLDLVADLENEFGIDLRDFLIGPDPEYVSTGLAGWLVGEPKKPVYRDVSLQELQEFLQAS